jgi:hypothetical protein
MSDVLPQGHDSASSSQAPSRQKSYMKKFYRIQLSSYQITQLPDFFTGIIPIARNAKAALTRRSGFH